MVDRFDEARLAAERFMASEGVVGVGEGETPDGRRAIVVMVTSGSEPPDLPSELEGIPVQVVETGPIMAEEDEEGDAAT